MKRVLGIRDLRIPAGGLAGDEVYDRRRTGCVCAPATASRATATTTGPCSTSTPTTPFDHHTPGHAVVLVRCHRYTRELSFYRRHSTAPVTLATLVDMVCVCRLDRGQATCRNS
ncbi:hypothetical protein ACIBJF_29785 [Streptomyces sp. NPDC050743]|uniref:hypothetical protein n=1 Tax=Streptomyces sp. NPDC050743 TaxID=3365634 RepID=UPI0037B39571